jgi:uridine phosphorylase
VSGDNDLPLLAGKSYGEPSVFVVENLLREARRQRGLSESPVPDVCLLDPDGDVVRHLRSTGKAERHPDWACYHTELWVAQVDGREIGIVACAVGAPFAVLVAEELAVSGCSLVVSVTSAGAIAPLGPLPHFMVINRALRDEGTSMHYLPPGRWSQLGDDLDAALDQPFNGLDEAVYRGNSWTTDAPFRETDTAIAVARAAGAHAVEMEAAALYAYAAARGRDVVCVAHLTNTMAITGDDFDKGDNDGTQRILALVGAIAGRLRPLD